MKKIKVRPGKAQSTFAMTVSCVFVGIGIFVVIPVFGVFGILWTLVAVAMTGMNAYHLFSGKGVVSHEIEIDDVAPQKSIEQRMALLDEFYYKGIITTEEYNEQRAKIISDI